MQRNNELYIGYTDNLIRRVKQHSAQYKCKLLYYEAYISEVLARTREQKIKQYGSAWQGLKTRLGIKRAGLLFSNAHRQMANRK